MPIDRSRSDAADCISCLEMALFTSQSCLLAVGFLNNNIINYVMIIKSYKSKSPLSSHSACLPEHGWFQGAILFKGTAQIIFFYIFFNTNKIFFTVKWAPGFTDPSLKTALWSHHMPINLVWSSIHYCSYLFNTRASHKTEALEGFVKGFTSQSVKAPYVSECSFKLSSVVSKLRPPINGFHNCSGSFGLWSSILRQDSPLPTQIQSAGGFYAIIAARIQPAFTKHTATVSLA